MRLARGLALATATVDRCNENLTLNFIFPPHRLVIMVYSDHLVSVSDCVTVSFHRSLRARVRRKRKRRWSSKLIKV